MKPKEKEEDWRFRVFDSLSYPTRILQPDGTIIAVNDVFLKVIDDNADAVVGRTCSNVNRQYFPDQPFSCETEEKCPLKRAVRLKIGQSTLMHTCSETGDTKWEHRVFSPILDDAGEVRYVIESFRDVTKIKVLEKLYSGMRELIDKVIDSSVSAIVAANRTGEIILANKAATDLFGFSIEETGDVNIECYYPEGVAREIMSKLRDDEFGGKGKLPITKVDVINKAGERIPVQMTAAIIYENGKEVATAGIFNDMREKLAVEQQLRDAQTKIGQTEKMASLGRLAAGVAHEINNPLTSILLYGNLMREKLEKDHPQSRNLDYVLEDADRCKEIVKNLLAYSRQSSLAKDVFPLNRLVTDSFKLLHDQRLFMHVDVIKKLDKEQVLIRADLNQVCQVLINLIMNGVDAMGEKGTLTIETGTSDDSTKAYIKMSDTGGGIPKENLLNIFDPFFTTKELGKGTGLGLSMAYGVMKEHDGRIFVKHTGPEGTTFVLEFPVINTSNEVLFDTIG